jgi:hypothetical protein
MNITFILMRLALTLRQLFDQQTVVELQTLKQHFDNAYTDTQIAAVVAIGILRRVFSLPADADSPGVTGSARAITPLDILIADGARALKTSGDLD